MIVSQSAVLLLFVAAVVAMLTRRLRFPYSIGLVLAGIALCLAPSGPTIHVPSDLIYKALLPPLLFEAAFYLRWDRLKPELPLVLTLAVGGVVIGGGVSAAGMHFLAGWPWNVALVFGALISATDPVSVLATFRQAGAEGRLALLIGSESLLNDGVAAVAFAVTVATAMGENLSPGAISARLVISIGLAILSGAAVAGGALFLAGRSEDHLVELTFTAVAAWGSFLLAEQLHASGVLAAIVAGLIMGNIGPMRVLSDQGREAVRSFWEFGAFVANSLVFLLIGVYQAEMYRSQGLSVSWIVVSVGAVVVLAGRAISVYGICGGFYLSRLRVKPRQQLGLVWGGMRGALALALALSLPEQMPQRLSIVGVSFAVVAFSIFAQGLTIPPFLRWVGELPETPSPQA